jgi:hypothetical protein
MLSEHTKGYVEREWDWWQEGRQQKERAQRWAVLREWYNGAPQSEEPADDDAVAQAALDDHELWLKAERQRRVDLAAKRYDRDRELLRLTLLRAEADGAFFAHVLEAPASPAQHKTAERRVAERSAAAKELLGKLGDSDDVVDSNGYFPADRRSTALNSHMTYWRHPALRELDRLKQRKRFKALMAMRRPDTAAMCSECEAPAQWNEYDLSLCLFRSDPPAGSTAAQIDALCRDGGADVRRARRAPMGWKVCPARLQR